MIKNFLKVPCSLCVETVPHRSKVVVTLDEHPDHHFYRVTQWDLENLEDDLPAHQKHQVLKSEIFSSDVLDGTPIHYQERPIETYYNHYAHPMERDTYDYFLSNYLNSEHHKSSRMVWLWRAFVKLNFSIPLLDIKYYERRYSSRIMECEQTIAIKHHKPEWRLWRSWERKLLKSGPVAAELIFSSSSSSSSSFSWLSD